MRRISLAILTIVMAASCGDAGRGEAVAGPLPMPNASEAPDYFPFRIVFDDLNVCTGQTVTYTFEGTRRTSVVNGRTISHVIGTVTSSDGFVGRFQRNWFRDEDDFTARTFDMERSADGQRMIWSAIFRYDIVDGQLVPTLEQFRWLCVGGGKPTISGS